MLSGCLRRAIFNDKTWTGNGGGGFGRRSKKKQERTAERLEIIAFCFCFNQSEKGLWISVKSCVQLPVPGAIATAVSLECKGSALCYCCDCIEWESCLFQAYIAIISYELMQGGAVKRIGIFLLGEIHSAEVRNVL